MILLAGDLSSADIGYRISLLTQHDSIRGVLDAVEPRFGGALVDLTVDGRPFTVFTDLLVHVARDTAPDVAALLRVNDVLTHELLRQAVTPRNRTDAA